MKTNERDIYGEFVQAYEWCFGWKVKELLIDSLNRSFQTVYLILGKEVVIKLIWNYLRPDHSLPTKAITAKQKKELLSQMEESINQNKYQLEQYKKTNPDNWEIEIKSKYHQFFGNTPFSYVAINDWEDIGDIFIKGHKDRFLYDYLNNLDNFSKVLSDEKVLMCAERGGGPPIELDGHLSIQHNQFCFLLAYAYLGILPTQISKNELHGILFLSNTEGIQGEDLDYLVNLLVSCQNNMEALFGKNPPRFLQEGLSAANTRFRIDCSLPVTATALSVLAGVNRKTIVNAKLSEAKDSISAKKAIDFLKSKARNRWTNDDEKGDPIGLKLLHSFKEFKFRENFYPSVSKFELD